MVVKGDPINLVQTLSVEAYGHGYFLWYSKNMPKISHEDLGIQNLAHRLLKDYRNTDGYQQEVVLGSFLVDIASMLGEEYIVTSLEFLCKLTDQGPEIADTLYSHYTAFLSRENATESPW